MKKYILVSLLVVMYVATSCSFSDSKPKDAPERVGWTSRERPPLYGDVAEVKVSTYDSSEGTAKIDQKSPVSTVLYHFNDDGNVVKRVVYNGDNITPDISESYKYNANGRVAEMTANHTTDNSQGEWQTTYNYNEQGLLVEEKVLFTTENILSAIWHYEYDSCRNRLHASKLDGGDVLIWETFWAYDQKGRVVKESRRNYEDASNVGDTCYKYAADGKLIGKEDFLPDYEEETKLITLYSYDKWGNVSEQVTKSLGGELYYSISYTYDKQGNVVEESVRGDNNQVERIVKYDILYCK